MPTPRYLVSLIVLLLGTAAGCKSVTSHHPIGDPVSPEVAQSLEGVWQIDDDDDSIVHIKSFSDGRFAAGGLDWKDDAFEAKTINGLYTTLDDHYYLQFDVREEDDIESGEPVTYLFGRVMAQNDRTLAVAFPNADAFAQAVDAGLVQGTVRRNNDEQVNEVIVDGDKALLDAWIDETKVAEQFHVNDLIIMRKLSGHD